MNRKQLLLTLSVAVISGFLGGAFSVWLLMPPSVLAQDKPPKQTIEAEEFVLKDAQGRIRAKLGTSLSDHPVLWFYDEEGRKGTTVGWSMISFYDGQSVLNKSGYVSGSAARFSDPDGRALTLTSWIFSMSEDDGSFTGKDTVSILWG